MKPDPRGGPELHWPGKRERRAEPTTVPRLTTLEESGLPALGGRSRLIRADNREAMRALLTEHAGKVDLVYVDPPFGTGGSFSLTARGGGEEVAAYSDRWSSGLGDYLSTMLEQLELLRALLSDRGTVFVHCDWHVSHHMRCLLDEVFGPDAFKNELVWRYRRWPAKTRVFQKMHDVIFWYGKTAGDAHAWTPQYEPLAASTLETWGTKRQVADFSSGRRKPSQTDEETPGAPMADVWDIGIIAPIARERVGYPTQKPEALLRRVIAAASKPGDLVMDVFAGSGTTLVVAEKMGRRWIGCDVGSAAIHASRKRLLAIGAAFEVQVIEGEGAGAGAGEGAGAGAAEGEGAAALVVTTEAAAGKRNVRVSLAGAEALDYWAVDWEHDGRVFRSAWHARREGKKQEMPLVTEHAYAAPGKYRIAVQVAGAAGGERRRVVEWVAE